MCEMKKGDPFAFHIVHVIEESPRTSRIAKSLREVVLLLTSVSLNSSLWRHSEPDTGRKSKSRNYRLFSRFPNLRVASSYGSPHVTSAQETSSSRVVLAVGENLALASLLPANARFSSKSVS